jgi:hypothetical protein
MSKPRKSLVGTLAMLWDREFRVMAHLEGYVMIRAKGVSPIAMSVTDYNDEVKEYIKRQQDAAAEVEAAAKRAATEQEAAIKRAEAEREASERSAASERLARAADLEWGALLKEVPQ